MAAAKDRVASRRSRALTFRSIETTPSKSVVNGGRIRKEWDSGSTSASLQPGAGEQAEGGRGARKSGIRNSVVRYSCRAGVSTGQGPNYEEGGVAEEIYVDDGVHDDKGIQPGPVQAGDADSAVNHIGGPVRTVRTPPPYILQPGQEAGSPMGITYDSKK